MLLQNHGNSTLFPRKQVEVLIEVDPKYVLWLIEYCTLTDIEFGSKGAAEYDGFQQHTKEELQKLSELACTTLFKAIDKDRVVSNMMHAMEDDRCPTYEEQLARLQKLDKELP